MVKAIAGIGNVKNFVVIDASPLIGLAIVDGLSWLPKLFDTIYVSKIVKSEVLPGTGVQIKCKRRALTFYPIYPLVKSSFYAPEIIGSHITPLLFIVTCYVQHNIRS